MDERTETREIVCWSCDDGAERLHCTVDDAVDEWVGVLCALRPLPEAVTVYEWARLPLPAASVFAGRFLDDMLERLDERHGDPDETTEPTQGMKDAEAAFIAAVLGEYTSWMCELVGETVVRVADYVDVTDYEIEATHG